MLQVLEGWVHLELRTDTHTHGRTPTHTDPLSSKDRMLAPPAALPAAMSDATIKIQQAFAASPDDPRSV